MKYLNDTSLQIIKSRREQIGNNSEKVHTFRSNYRIVGYFHGGNNSWVNPKKVSAMQISVYKIFLKYENHEIKHHGNNPVSIIVRNACMDYLAIFTSFSLVAGFSSIIDGCQSSR